MKLVPAKHAVRAAVVVEAVDSSVAAVAAAAAVRVALIAVVIAVDRSRSTDLVPEVDTRLRALLAEAPRAMERRDLLGVVSFGREVDTALAPSVLARGAVVALPGPPGGAGARDETDIAGAIQHALGDIPADTSGRIVVISDGDQTVGDARAADVVDG